jgi:hypothetical protein
LTFLDALCGASIYIDNVAVGIRALFLLFLGAHDLRHAWKFLESNEAGAKQA